VLPLRDNIPTDRFPVVTVALIVINIVVFVFFQHTTFGLLSASPSNAVVAEWGAIPYEFTHPGRECELVGQERLACEGQPGVAGQAEPQPPTWLTALSAMFMHGGLLHIAGNMLFLWIFGNNVEDSMGRWRFILFYLLGGFIALAAQIAVDPNAAVPTIGASGAIAGVLGGYILLYPRARVLTAIFVLIVFFVELPAWLVLGFWFAQQVLVGYTELGSFGVGGVAYWAHIGGFVFGLLLVRAFARRRKQPPPPRPLRRLAY
jgi:membrane associated rhomboid family serine protease